MLEKVSSIKFSDFTEIADTLPFGKVYPLSLCGGFQSGDIYTNGRAVLFWHLCGFGLVGGDVTDAFLCEIKKLMENGGRRLVLFADDKTAGYFGEGFSKARRLFFEYRRNVPPEYYLPAGYEIKAFDKGLISRAEGRIAPAFSWESAEQFLEHATGFCVTYEGLLCAWAFSAAVGGNETDIGVECMPEFQRKGLAYCAAAEMTGYVLKNGRRPVWACHEGNKASSKLAEKLGFEKCGECIVIHRT